MVMILAHLCSELRDELGRVCWHLLLGSGCALVWLVVCYVARLLVNPGCAAMYLSLVYGHLPSDEAQPLGSCAVALLATCTGLKLSSQLPHTVPVSTTCGMPKR